MKEAFLHFIWQQQYYNKKGLTTTQGEPLIVIKQGYPNSDAGPDFTEAKIKIGEIEWAGQVEIHVKSSEWIRHGHQHDGAYDSTILHVVLEEDQPIQRRDGSQLPTLALAGLIQEETIQQYQALLTNSYSIACAPLFSQVSDIKKLSMLDRALLQRLERKAVTVLKLLHQNRGDWEETAYQLLAQNMGFKINSPAFLQMAQSLPLKFIQKHSDSLLQVEALLFGQAGLLDEEFIGDYSAQLYTEYLFLSHKFGLWGSKLERHSWKFLRLRPANFPTVRLAQLSSILYNNKGLFSKLLEISSPKQLMQLLQSPLSAYWQQHYDFGKPAFRATGEIGKSSVENILINTVVPLIVAYAMQKDKKELIDNAVSLLEALKPEDNKITRFWKQDLKLPLKTAADAQACIELHNYFCLEKRCLECNIGVSILKG